MNTIRTISGELVMPSHIHAIQDISGYELSAGRMTRFWAGAGSYYDTTLPVDEVLALIAGGSPEPEAPPADPNQTSLRLETPTEGTASNIQPAKPIEDQSPRRAAKPPAVKRAVK